MAVDDSINDVIQWGIAYLSSHGYTLKSNVPENVQDRPWSYVVRFATTDGYIYLKRTPKLIALEANITQILHGQFHAPVPEVIAHNAELNSFLMKDAGSPLRPILKEKFKAELLCKGIHQLTSLQLDVAGHVDVFIDIGVPDWRLDKLPHLYEQLMAKKDILIADGLSEIEISELNTLPPKISHLCEKLADYSIKQTIVQPDFHDNNLVIDDAGNITIIDLGEIVISHPFFSLINCLRQTKKHHALTDVDDAYLQIMDACLENYVNVESKKRLLDALVIAQILWFAYGALANVRLMEACGIETLMAFQPGRLSSELKELLAACDAINHGS